MIQRPRTVVIGGGFYGTYLAAILQTIGHDVTLLELKSTLLARASKVNQARVHTGFHYPRSPITAMKSLLLHKRFIRDFEPAIVDDFQMLYAIARRRSKISASRFYRMFKDMGAPISPAEPHHSALFDHQHIEQVFQCNEYAFDYRILADHLKGLLGRISVDVRFHACAEHVELQPSGKVRIRLRDHNIIDADWVFNVSYSAINSIRTTPTLKPAALKHEIAELALVEPPATLLGLGVTVMDGPFFSLMPYPSRNLYSLTHVRYTPHLSFTDDQVGFDPYAVLDAAQFKSRASFMRADAARYLPSISSTNLIDSVFEVKTVLMRSEVDDSRPILFRRSTEIPNLITIMGGKIDNVYDLIDVLTHTHSDFHGLDTDVVAMRT